MNILIPMAGEGSRFVAGGFKEPKPLVKVLGEPMVKRVIDSLSEVAALNHKFIFIVQLRHIWEFHIEQKLREWAPGATVIAVDGPTAGAAVTALRARAYIDNYEALLIANSDQLVHGVPTHMDEDGLIYTFPSNNTKWSYAAVDEKNRVWGVAEKQVISRHATCGVYYWKRGSDFVKYADRMIQCGRRCNNEFYIAPVYNEAIVEGKVIRAADVQEMWGLGTPEDLKAYEDANRPR